MTDQFIPPFFHFLLYDVDDNLLKEFRFPQSDHAAFLEFHEWCNDEKNEWELCLMERNNHEEEKQEQFRDRLGTGSIMEGILK